jgi:transketolase
MGKGVPAIEGDFRWHGKAPSKEQAMRFINELDQQANFKKQKSKDIL